MSLPHGPSGAHYRTADQGKKEGWWYQSGRDGTRRSSRPRNGLPSSGQTTQLLRLHSLMDLPHLRILPVSPANSITNSPFIGKRKAITTVRCRNCAKRLDQIDLFDTQRRKKV
jgi:hypothetical protein